MGGIFKRLIIRLAITIAVILPSFIYSMPVAAADYSCDGTSDNVEIQAALDALPSTGGRITIGAGTYNFTATVARSIDNVIIEGVGATTVINYNGTTPVFSAGSQAHWVFRNLKTDAGGINITSATKWIEDDVTIGSTHYSFRSSGTFTPTADSVHIMSATGSSDNVLISNAIAAGYNNILLNSGTYDIDGYLYLEPNTKLLGVGNSTILNFTDNADAEILIEDSNNVEIGNFKITGTPRGVGGIFLEANTTDLNNIFVHDVSYQGTGSYAIHLYPLATSHTGREISDVMFANITITAPDGFGYMQTGNGTNPTFTDITLYKVDITDAGVASSRLGDWVTAYDFNEDPDAIMTNLSVIDCVGDGAWESVFHFENYAGKTNCVLIQCSANDGGHKTTPTWGAGYRVNSGVKLYTCSATNNKGNGYYNDGGAATLYNCYAQGNGDADISQTDYTYTIESGAVPAAPTNVAASDGTYTDKVIITWTKSSGATGYRVYRDSTDISGLLGDVSTFTDTGADAPTITPGASSASDGTFAGYVTLSVAGETATNGTTHSYKVVAVGLCGNSADSVADNGYRGTTTLTYQWYRSLSDSDSNFALVSGGTTDPYNDTTAPSNGSRRYYYCAISMNNATTQYTTHDSGETIPAYKTVEGDYYGDTKIPLYNIKNVYWEKIRYLKIAIDNQEDWEIKDSGPIYGATVSLFQYYTDVIPLVEVHCTGIVGPDSESYQTVTLFNISGIDGVTGDSVMIMGKFYFDKLGNVYYMAGTILVNMPDANPLNNMVGSANFKVPWH